MGDTEKRLRKPTEAVNTRATLIQLERLRLDRGQMPTGVEEYDSNRRCQGAVESGLHPRIAGPNLKRGSHCDSYKEHGSEVPSNAETAPGQPGSTSRLRYKMQEG
jgi:hypothetical protein